MPKVVQQRAMQVSADTLRRVILDFEKYPEFMSEVVRSQPRPSAPPEQPLVDFEIEVIKHFHYTLEFDLAKPNEIHWRLVESDFFTSNEGAWILTPVSDKETDVRYELEVGVKFLIPGWIARKLTEVNLPRLLDGVETRCKAVERQAR